MTVSLRPADRRALVAGVLIVGSLVTLSRGVPVLRSHESALANRVAERTLVLRQLEQNEAALSAVVASVADYGNSSLDARTVSAFAGATPTAAVAQAAEYVASTAYALGAEVSSVSPSAPDRFTEGLAALEVKLTLVSDAEGLRDLLTAIERGPRLMVPRALSVFQSSPAASASEAEALRVELTIEGLGRQAERAKP